MSSLSKVLIACEFSGIVRDAFLERGINAWSCDLLPTESLPQYHLQMDVFEAIRRAKPPWDLMIAFPPCTHLASSGWTGRGARPDGGHGPGQRGAPPHSY